MRFMKHVGGMNKAAKRRGAPKRGEPSARERLIETVAECFYREGVRAVGIDTIAERAGVSKSSLYRTFESKDELIAAFAEEQNRRYWQWWDQVVDAHQGPARAKIEALFKALAEQISSPQFRGCPFINLATEIPDRQHPSIVIACANKEEVRRRLCVLSRDLGVGNPRRLAARLALIIDGAYGRAVTLGTKGLEREVLEVVRLVVDAAVAEGRT
jgi:AcrR family transcriptional regulator